MSFYDTRRSHNYISADLGPLQFQISWLKNLNSSGLVSFLKRFLRLIQATYYVLLPD